MYSNQKQANIILIVGLIAAVAIIGLIFYLGAKKARQPAAPESETKTQPTPTQKLIEIDATDPSHINNVKYIQGTLERYYADKHYYPKQLEELVPYYLKVLPKYSSSRNYFYAYSPENKPQKYHIGALLGGRNEASPVAFSSDDDFNSAQDGYVNGFNGMDPVFDLKGEK